MKPPYLNSLPSRILQVTLAIFSILGGLALAAGWAYPLIYNSIYRDPFPVLLLLTAAAYWWCWPLGIGLVLFGISLIWNGISLWRKTLRRKVPALGQPADGPPVVAIVTSSNMKSVRKTLHKQQSIDIGQHGDHLVVVTPHPDELVRTTSAQDSVLLVSSVDDIIDDYPPTVRHLVAGTLALIEEGHFLIEEGQN